MTVSAVQERLGDRGQNLRRHTHATRASRRAGQLFVMPFLVLLVTMVGGPIVYAAYLSLFQDQMVGGSAFVGLDNFTSVLTDAQFWDGLSRVARIFAVQVPIMLLLGLIAALIIDSGRLRFRGFFRILLFVPYAVPGVVAALIWGFIYGDQFGLTASINELFGSRFLQPLSAALMPFSIGNILTWSFLGYNMLIIYSGLKAVPHEIYDAAEIDGANQFQVVRYVKVPAVRNQLVISLMFSIIGTMGLFNEPNLLQPLAPGVISSHYTPNIYAYTLSVTGNRTNLAAALALVMGVATGAAAYLTQSRSSKGEQR